MVLLFQSRRFLDSGGRGCIVSLYYPSLPACIPCPPESYVHVITNCNLLSDLTLTLPPLCFLDKPFLLSSLTQANPCHLQNLIPLPASSAAWPSLNFKVGPSTASTASSTDSRLHQARPVETTCRTSLRQGDRGIWPRMRPRHVAIVRTRSASSSMNRWV